MRRLLSHLLLVASIPALAAACGGEAASGGADPASLVPATASVYVEGVVRPEGDLRDDVLAAAGKLLRTDDPEGRIHELLAESEHDPEDGLDFKRDLEPWLGERAGVWVTNLEADEPQTLVVLASKDADAARKAADAGFRRERRVTREASHKGVDYKVDRDGIAYGIVEDFMAIGHEAPFKRAVEAADGTSLAESDLYKDTIAGLEEARIGTAFLDVGAVARAAAKAGGEADSLEAFKGMVDLDKLPPVGAALLADGDRVAVESLISAKGGGELLSRLSLLSGGGTTPLVADLPGDSWLAYGIPKLGETGKAIYESVAGGLAGAAISGQIKEQTGLDLEQDVFAWMGDAAFFARGTDEASIAGGLVIEATDMEKAKRAVTRLVGAATRQSPGTAAQPHELDGSELTFRADVGEDKPLIVAVGNGRVVVAYGELAARDGLEAAEKLGDTDGFEAAAQTLGGDADPAVYVAMPEVVKLLDASEAAAGDDYAKAKPYLEAIASIVAGTEEDGDRLRSRFALELK